MRWCSLGTGLWTCKRCCCTIMLTAPSSINPTWILLKLWHCRFRRCLLLKHPAVLEIENAILCQWIPFPRRMKIGRNPWQNYPAPQSQTSAAQNRAASRPAFPLVPIPWLLSCLAYDILPVRTWQQSKQNKRCQQSLWFWPPSRSERWWRTSSQRRAVLTIMYFAAV